MFSRQQLKKLENVWSTLRMPVQSQLNLARPRMEIVHAALELASDMSADTLKGELLNKLGDKSKLVNMEVPICLAMQESAQAYLHGTFLTGFPLFESVASKANEATAAMLTTLTGRDQIRFNWQLELDRCMQDVLNYNVCMTEIAWSYKRANSASTRITAGSPITGQVAPITYEGNAIIRRDPYNSFYSTICEPSKVHEDGTYSGYVDQVDYIGLKRLYSQWNTLYTFKENIEPIFQGNGAMSGSDSGTGIFKRLITAKQEQQTAVNSWPVFWGAEPSITMAKATGVYEVVTVYIRLIPAEFGITELEFKGNPRVFKLIFVNNLLAYAEPIVAGHDYLPLIVSQYKAGGPDTKSFVENVMGMQNLSTGLITASLDSMRRAVTGGDRYYDAAKISGDSLNSRAASKNIPVKLGAMDKDFSRAVYNVPYQDHISGNFAQFMSLVQGLAQMATGINPSAQGNFIKGNKTVHEFDTIMSNSQARLQLGAIRLEGTLFSTIKEIIKLNYLLYSQSEKISDNSPEGEITVDPVMLRETAPDFKMADGLMPSTKLANTDAMVMALQTMQMNPELAITYDLGAILLSVLQQNGLTNINDYKRTPEQQQALRDQQVAQAAAMAQAQTPPQQAPVQ